MPSILFGSSSTPVRVAQGEFYCPECKGRRGYNRTEVRRSIRVLGASVVSYGKLGEYVECRDCYSTFRPEVLAYDGGSKTSYVMAEYKRAMLRSLALMVAVDGKIREPELETVQDVFEAVCGRRLTRDEVLEEVEDVAAKPITVARYLAQVVGFLNPYGKEQVLRAAALVSKSDGELHDRERGMIKRFGAVLQMPDQQIERILPYV